MTDRTTKLAGFLALVVSWGLLAFTWELNARGQRAFAVAVAKNEAARARFQALLDREHREAVEVKALLETLLRRLDGAEAVRPGRIRQQPMERRID